MSLISQILKSDKLFFEGLQHYYTLIKDYSTWRVDEIWIFFWSVICSPKLGGIICTIDAFEDFNDPSDQALQDFMKLGASRDVKLKFILTSRLVPYPDTNLPLSINLDNEPGLDKDVEITVKSVLKDKAFSNQLFLDFEEVMTEHLCFPGITHLEVALLLECIDWLTTRSTQVAIVQKISSLGRNLKEIYDVLFKNVDQSPAWIRTAFSWALYSLRPLKIGELSIGIAMDKSTVSSSIMAERVPRNVIKDLRQFLGPLFFQGNDEFRFVHPSIRCFLLDRKTPVDHMSAQDKLTRICLSYLSMIYAEDEPHMMPRISRRLLLNLEDYAAEYWPEHYQRAGGRPSLSGEVMRFFDDRERCVRWYKSRCRLVQTMDHRANPESSLQVAAELGFSEIVSALLNRISEQAISEVDKRAALDLSIANGHTVVARQLLDVGVSPTKLTSLASVTVSPKFIKEILENFVGSDEFDAESRRQLYIEAAKRGLLDVIDYFQMPENEIDTYAPDIRLLHIAVQGGNLIPVQRFLRASSGHLAVGLLDKDNYTALHIAARDGHCEIARELIRVGANPNAENVLKTTPLHLAAGEGHLALVEDLIQAGAKASSSDDNMWTPLHMAACSGYPQIVDLLVLNGADCSSTTSKASLPLHLAAREEHVTVVKRLLTLGSDINAINKDGFTPLHLAAAEGHIETVREILKSIDAFKGIGGIDLKFQGETRNSDSPALPSGKDPIKGCGDAKPRISDNGDSDDLGVSEDEDEDGTDLVSTPLHDAAQRGHLDVVKVLLQAGVDYNARNYNMETALHRAAIKGHVNVLREILKAGAKVDIASYYDYTPLLLACEQGNILGIEALVRAGANLDSKEWNGATLLYLAARNGNARAVKLLIKSGADVTISDDSLYSPLHIAAQGVHVQVVRLLLEPAKTAIHTRHAFESKQCVLHLTTERDTLSEDDKAHFHRTSRPKTLGVDAKSKDGVTALMLAANSGSETVVRRLLEAGANVHALAQDKSSLLLYAASGGDVAVVKLFLEAGVDRSSERKDGQTALSLASENGHEGLVQFLLEQSMNPNSVDSKGRTPLLCAAQSGHELVIECLFRGGAQVLDSDNKGHTALHLATLAENMSLMSSLVKKGVCVSAKDKQGNTALSTAVAVGNLDLVRLLLRTGIDVNTKNDRLMTLFHLAVEKMNQDMTQLLLEYGAEKNELDIYGWDPFHLAWMYGQHQICDMISGGREESEAAVKRQFGNPPNRLTKAILSSKVTISDNGLTASTRSVCSSKLARRLQVRMNMPMPAGAYTFYFEVAIAKADSKDLVAIGFCESDSQRTRLPGWGPRSWGYHGNDGKKFVEVDVGMEYGPTYSTGDVVGCGVDFVRRSAFFTINGKKLDNVASNITGRFFPVIGFGGPDAEVTVNFGPDNFCFQDPLAG